MGCCHQVYPYVLIAGTHAPDGEVPLGEPSSCDGRLRVPGDYQVWSTSKVDCALKLVSSQVNHRVSPE